ncbi:phage tail protein I [Desulfobaculum senezii]
MPRHLLPPSATAMERALSEAVARLSDVGVPLRAVWRAGECPEPLLAWLAWSLSVDAWDESWTEAQKREAIRAAVWVHRHKGTRGAVDRAVRALGYRVRIREWWEENPKGEPYTFAIEIEVDDRGVDAGLYGMLTRVVDAAKNARSHLRGFAVVSTSRGYVHAGMALHMGAALTVLPWRPKNIEQTSPLHVGATLQTFTTVTAQP